MKADYIFKKHTVLSLKDLSKSKSGKMIMKGYASTWNTDLVGDEMQKGCFEDCLKINQQKWFVFFNHNPDNIIGINTKAMETDEGLYIESELLENKKTEYILSVIKAGLEHDHSMGLSIGGKIKDLDLKKDGGGVKINKFQILEHSITPIPCNEQSRIEEVQKVTKYFFPGEQSPDLENDYLERFYKLEQSYINRINT